MSHVVPVPVVHAADDGSETAHDDDGDVDAHRPSLTLERRRGRSQEWGISQHKQVLANTSVRG